MIIFDTASEFFDACERGSIPATIYVDLDDDEWVGLSGEDSIGFGLAKEITRNQMIEEAFRRAKTSVYIT